MAEMDQHQLIIYSAFVLLRLKMRYAFDTGYRDPKVFSTRWRESLLWGWDGYQYSYPSATLESNIEETLKQIEYMAWIEISSSESTLYE